MAFIERTDCTTRNWTESLQLACRWITERAMIRSTEPPFDADVTFKNPQRYPDWRGAFRGEYSSAQQRWDVFGPIWHTGHGVKALALAGQALDDRQLLDEARYAADFLLRHQNRDESNDDHGLIPAYEDDHCSSTSCLLEGLSGLFTLSEVTDDSGYADAAIRALRWVQRKAFMPEEGLFRDGYNLQDRRFEQPAWWGSDVIGRPLIDDGVFITGYERTGDESFKAVMVRLAERLLADEDPPGNWKLYPPNVAATGKIHPRHAYWWGRPLWMVHRHTGDQRYLDACRRSAQWYVRAMRADGGIFRDTYPDFTTPSFGQATSGIACAVILWHDLAVYAGDTQWDGPMRKAIRFCRSMQMVQCQDENLHGAILEKVHPPCGSDAPPWYLRDVGTSFYVQAVCMLMRNLPRILED